MLARRHRRKTRYCRIGSDFCMRWYTVRVRDFIEELCGKDLSQVTPKVEHPSAGGRLRDPHRAELARPC